MDNENPAHRAALSTEDYHALTGFEGDWRDTWWDDAFLAMMAVKWGLDRVHTALDVGCGVGHWGQRLMRHLPDDTTLFGVDAEQAWVDAARTRAVDRGLAERSKYELSRAEALPFADASLDMVTCQTLLIHVADLDTVLREMIRVLRPGGLFLVAEPNNFAGSAGELVSAPLLPWHHVSDLLELQYRCTQGKLALGEGHQSAGHLVLAGLHAQGWTDVSVHMNSQTARVAPPYTDLNGRSMVEYLRTCHATGAAMALGSTEANCRRYFLAGGGEAERFPALWQLARTRLADILAAVDAGSYVSSGGHVHYLVWGRKPGQA